MAGIDVIVVHSDHDERSLLSSEFHVSFHARNPLVEDGVVGLLGLHQRRSLPSQGTTAFQSVFHITNNAQEEYVIPTRFHNVSPEWVDIFCNDNKVTDVLAFVGPDDSLLFLDHTAASNGSAIFTKTPSSSILQLFPLRMGHNAIVCRPRRRTGMSTSQVDFSMWLFASTAQFVIFDVDGTITKSDVRGIVETVPCGVYTYTHDGVIPFLQSLTQRLQIHVLYLTARSITHMNETRAFLHSTRDAINGEGLPRGPILCNPERLMKAFYREVILKDSVTLKSGILLRISEMFRIAQNHAAHGMVNTSGTGASTLGVLTNVQHQRLEKDSHDKHGNVFVVGVGNRMHDGDAYRLAGVPASCVLIIDTEAVIKIWSDHYATTTVTVSSSLSSSGSPLSPSNDGNKIKDSAHPPEGSFDTYNDPRLVPYLQDAYLRHHNDQLSR